MKHLRSVLSLVFLSAFCVSTASCADVPSRRYGTQDSGVPAPASPQAESVPGAPPLTIQSGEGEKLNLPWFVRDIQDWVNQDSTAPGAGRPAPNW
ncbi:hypothetical protein CAL28_10955 [Bordetella genomosp. 11]|uniref:Lipoprotein n=1 Tax=Bordetella genomosp. 11 TaxID=1416808 RepID=A0A261UEH4_9BORD|nr:hypothetical protein [Bordetella genomosp. 11]OZI59991.1 hypothetical protein CAL28_10955 [Bordetella genomosp. 11]